MLEAFRAEMAKVALRTPKIPYISNLSGTWITDAEAVSPEYWAKHLRNAVSGRGGPDLRHAGLVAPAVFRPARALPDAQDRAS